MSRPSCLSDARSYGRHTLLVLAGALVLFCLPAGIGAADPLSAGSTKTDLKTVTIPVAGMACISCAASVKSAIKSLAGVSRVEVSLEKRSALVTYAANQISPDRIAAAINNLSASFKAGAPKEVE